MRTTLAPFFCALILSLSPIRALGSSNSSFLRQVQTIQESIAAGRPSGISPQGTPVPMANSTSNREKSPGAGLQFREIPPFNQRRNSSWGPVLTDIVNHEAPWDSNNYNDLVTKAHETTHGIQAHLRNKLPSEDRGGNAFYVLDNQFVVLPEPKMRKSAIAAFVPKSLQGSKFKTYITGQTAWDHRPLYVFDEWNSYINGGAAAIDLHERGLWKAGRRDAVSGQQEFSAYAIATAMAIKSADPEYFERVPQFKVFLAWNLERSSKIFSKGSAIAPFKNEKQEKYRDAFLKSPDGEDLRGAVRTLFGAEWTEETLGF